MIKFNNFFRLIVSLLAGCLASNCGSAQAAKTLYTAKGTFSPGSAKVSSFVALNLGYSPAQVQTFTKNVNAFMEVIHKTPCLHPPRGYDVDVYMANCADGSCDGSRVMTGRTGFIIREWTITNESQVPKRADIGPSIEIFINDLQGVLKTQKQDVIGYREPRLLRMIDGFPLLEGGLLVITNIKRPLFRYVTEEEVLRWNIERMETALKNARESAAKINKDPKSTSAEIEGYKKYVAGFVAEVKKYQDKLNALSVEERKANARSITGGNIALPNPDFFDTSRSKTDIQLAVIELYKLDLKQGVLSHQLIQQIRESIDLKSLLNHIR